MEGNINVHREKLQDLQKIANQISIFVGPDSSIQIESDIFELEKQLCEIVEAIETCKKDSKNNNEINEARRAIVSKSYNLIDNVKEVNNFLRLNYVWKLI